MKWIWLYAMACNEAEHHEHGHDHGHGHAETVQQTVWSSRLEVFVEYPQLKPNQEAEMLAHITWLDGHRPMSSGSITVQLKNATDTYRFETKEPARTGIFTPRMLPKVSGEYQLLLSVQSGEHSEDIDLGMVSVGKEKEHGHHDHGHGHDHAEEPEISLLKEQAWKMDFETAPVQPQTIHQSIQAVGTWAYAAQDKQKVVATTSGVLFLDDTPPLSGQTLSRGDRLAVIQSETLTKDSVAVQWRQKQAQWAKVQSEYARKETLYQEGILSKAQLEEMEQRYQVVKAEYDILRKHNRGGMQQIRSPIDGRILQFSAKNGDFVEQGDDIFSMLFVDA